MVAEKTHSRLEGPKELNPPEPNVHVMNHNHTCAQPSISQYSDAARQHTDGSGGIVFGGKVGPEGRVAEGAQLFWYQFLPACKVCIWTT